MEKENKTDRIFIKKKLTCCPLFFMFLIISVHQSFNIFQKSRLFRFFSARRVLLNSRTSEHQFRDLVFIILQVANKNRNK